DGKRDEDNGWGTEGHRRKLDNTAVFVAEKPFGFPGGTEITFVLRCESRHIRHLLARVRLSIAAAEATALPEEIRPIVAKPRDQRTPEEAAQLRTMFRTNIYQDEAYRNLAALETQRKAFRQGLDKIKVMVMDTRDKPRETRIL